ncbi:MAG: hypothetical protein ABI460_00510 [Caldimonas sp.]
MTDSENAWLSRSRWIEAFVDHVASEMPDAPMHRLAANAARLFACLGQFDPVDVAEAEWGYLGL